MQPSEAKVEVAAGRFIAQLDRREGMLDMIRVYEFRQCVLGIPAYAVDDLIRVLERIRFAAVASSPGTLPPARTPLSSGYDRD